MSPTNPIQIPKKDYTETIKVISSDSSVGIDAQYTHAIIIEYLKQLDSRLAGLEKKIDRLENSLLT